MKIREEFQLKTVGNQYLVTQKRNDSKKLLFALNETGAFLWKGISEGKTKEELVQMLCEEYEAGPGEEDVISSDVNDFLEQLRRVDALEEA